MLRRAALLMLLLLLVAVPVDAAKKAKAEPEPEDEFLLNAKTFKGLALREIGPALASGRIGDIAVHPRHKAHWIVAVASGGVWKTTNAGTTWTPIFDNEGSYSIGCVTIDPNNPLNVWVGSGENNSQRSVSYGDGLYKSIDGGTTWKNVGLVESEHIGKILVDPRDSSIVWVAAQGPLWRAGGDRGLYKTIDGGETWDLALEISENTGVTDIVLDPRNPDVIYAAAYQRRRHVWTLINGGPESAIYKSTNGGESWAKLSNGLPEVEMGRIGLALAPANPDVVYAIVEAQGDEGGFFRSVDAGGNWEKRSDYVAGSPQYYNEIVADPKNVDRVYSLDTWLHVTEDCGKSFQRTPNNWRHVDDHALWIDPDDTDHLVVGCDGGVYESWDRSETWEFKANLPVTQFYRATPDNDAPFYNVYGGTQDNNTIGGPARNNSEAGILNRDWFVTVGGDGFKTQIDPTNPDLVYSQSQYGVLNRFDRASGENIDIQPQHAPGEDPLRWNWDSALIISPHSHTRLYFAAQRVFRSDDRGDGWTPISPDLTRQLDRDQMEVMGKVQSVDAVAKSISTSPYGNIVSLSESPFTEDLLYAGTDDGLIQVLEDGNWRKIDSFPGIPELSYVVDIEASVHDADTVFAAFDNHKQGDFKPYLLRSDDRGRSWTSISSNLPERGYVHSVVQDHVKPDLLFAGTEFGIFFSVDGGGRWVQLEGGIPTIAVFDAEIQRRENDLVLGSFGRGFFILDDYTPLRHVSESMLEQEAELFPVKQAWAYIPRKPFGFRGIGFQGDAFYSAPNPPFGAVFTYYLKEELKTLEKARQAREAEAGEKSETTPYPTWDELRAEDREEAPAILFTVYDDEGNVVRRVKGKNGAGIQRVAWDLRHAPSEPTDLKERKPAPWDDPAGGPLALPGHYTVRMAKRVGGVLTELGEPQRFEVVPLGTATLPAEDRAELLEFQQKVARLQRAVLGAVRAAGEVQVRINHIKQALLETPGAPAKLNDDVRAIEVRLKDLQVQLSGDGTLTSRAEPAPKSIRQRVGRIVSGQWASTSAPTQTNRDAYRYAGEAFTTVLGDLRNLVERDLTQLEQEMEAVLAPWTPGRLPRWRME